MPVKRFVIIFVFIFLLFVKVSLHHQTKHQTVLAGIHRSIPRTDQEDPRICAGGTGSGIHQVEINELISECTLI